MVKYKIEWSIDAKLDLIDILQFYIDRNGSSAYSRKLNNKINKVVSKLIKYPYLGLKTNWNLLELSTLLTFRLFMKYLIR